MVDKSASLDYIFNCQEKVWRYQRGNQKPKKSIEEKQTIEWPKEKGQTIIYKTLHRKSDSNHVLDMFFIQMVDKSASLDYIFNCRSQELLTIT
jgi:hypothetical protein